MSSRPSISVVSNSQATQPADLMSAGIASGSLFAQFLRVGLYLRNWSKRTVRTYGQGLRSLHQSARTETPTKTQLDFWVVAMREKGLTPAGCNQYIRTINSYLTWLKEEGHLPAPLKVKQLKAPQRQLTLLSQQDIKAILLHTPKGRAWTLILLLLDTGIRIEEALTLERSKVDLDNLVLNVIGKGDKERPVPFSLEMRKHLFRHLRSTAKLNSPYVFCTRSGGRLNHRNTYRETIRLCQKAGVKTRVHPHLFRHQFAASYIRQGGDIYRLSRLLGHTSVSTTQLYLRSMGVEDLRAGKERLTPLRLGV